MVNFPVAFIGQSQATSGIKTAWMTSASEGESACCIPPEFEGQGGNFSPEDFFLLALQNCFVATFKVYAEYSKLSFTNLQVKGELIVDKNDDGKPVMKDFNLMIEIDEVQDQKKALLLIKKTLSNGFILQSVKTNVVSHILINGVPVS
jgi:organic hydroperoxide reductase OsmC/OhrA